MNTATKPTTPGIHHVTGISGPAQENVDFYAGALGLRLVKRTVNFDDPKTYHLYYGDEMGRPGSILTFFPWAGVPRGRAGRGATTETAFAVAPDQLDFWMGRLADLTIEFDAPVERFGDQVLPLRDPDGLPLAIVADEAAADIGGWDAGPVPAEAAIRGFHGVTLASTAPEETARVLSEMFGYQRLGEEDGRIRFGASGDGHLGKVVDLIETDVQARNGVGTIHHVAFRARDLEEQEIWRVRAASFGLRATPIQDRNYFQSIYFREPGGILFEMATDPPGFTADESPDELGFELKLPEWLEPQRRELEASLPQIRIPK